MTDAKASTDDDPMEVVRKLQIQCNELRAHKKTMTRELRNAQSRKTRLKNKAKLLSDSDLLNVIKMRKRQQDEASLKAKAATQAEAAPGTASSSSSALSTNVAAPAVAIQGLSVLMETAEQRRATAADVRSTDE